MKTTAFVRIERDLEIEVMKEINARHIRSLTPREPL